jgi:hypothetical protein
MTRQELNLNEKIYFLLKMFIDEIDMSFISHWMLHNQPFDGNRFHIFAKLVY